MLSSSGMDTCPQGWTASSEGASPAGLKCYGLPQERSLSLRHCASLCAEYSPSQAGSPACISSASEAAFVRAEVAPAGEPVWLGLYRNDTGGQPEEGWGGCASGSAPSFENWLTFDAQPDNYFEREECVQMHSNGQWADVLCKDSRVSARCLCTLSNQSEAFGDDLAALEASVEAACREAPLRAATAFGVAASVSLLPSFYLLCRLWQKSTPSRRRFAVTLSRIILRCCCLFIPPEVRHAYTEPPGHPI